MSAYLNTISTIIFAEALTEAINKNYPVNNIRLKNILSDITDACEHAYQHWKPLNDKDAVKMLKLFAKMQQSIVEKEENPRVYTNYVLGKIDDLITFIKNPIRRAAIMAIYDAVFALHLYFDHNLKDQDSIDKAVLAMQEWRTYLEDR